MRIYAKKVGLLVLGGLSITLILTVLPHNAEIPLKIFDATPQAPPSLRKLNKKSSSSNDKPSTDQKGGPQGPTPWPQEDYGKLEKWTYSRTIRTLDPKLVEMKKYLEPFGSLEQMYKEECSYNETLGHFWRRVHKRVLSKTDSWEKYYEQIGTCDMYRSDKIIDNLLHDMATMPIKHAENMDGGTQVKLVITFENGKKAVFKPMRFGRDYETDPNHFYFSDFERHVAEIAAFHLDRVLGFRRAVPTVGRVLNMSSELRPVSEKKLAKTFFISPANNLCFVSKCDYYCDTTHAMCGKPDLKEGSFQAFLPDEDEVPRIHSKSPYRRTYSKRDQIAVWQRDNTYCGWKVKKKRSYAHGRRLPDFIDLHIIDFLMGNQDRHHFESFAFVDDLTSYPILLDNGRGFGKTKFDDMDILLPLTQCCVIKPSTLKVLLDYYSGPVSLTEAFHESLSKDPVAPILPAKHYSALERRLEIILKAVRTCMDNAEDVNDVLMAEYHNPDVPEREESQADDAVDPNERGNKEKPEEK